jgi:hypothetical protein
MFQEGLHAICRSVNRARVLWPSVSISARDDHAGERRPIFVDCEKDSEASEQMRTKSINTEATCAELGFVRSHTAGPVFDGRLNGADVLDEFSRLR